MLTCSFVVLLRAGSSLYSASGAACNTCYSVLHEPGRSYRFDLHDSLGLLMMLLQLDGTLRLLMVLITYELAPSWGGTSRGRGLCAGLLSIPLAAEAKACNASTQ
jgi:hypothetical protein